jgi:hypothetical protein
MDMHINKAHVGGDEKLKESKNLPEVVHDY